VRLDLRFKAVDLLWDDAFRSLAEEMGRAVDPAEKSQPIWFLMRSWECQEQLRTVKTVTLPG